VGIPVVHWLAMRRRMHGAGWFNVVNMVLPIAALLVVGTPADPKDAGSSLQTLLILGGLFVANLGSGLL
jgi:hypothetical protein